MLCTTLTDLTYLSAGVTSSADKRHGNRHVFAVAGAGGRVAAVDERRAAVVTGDRQVLGVQQRVDAARERRPDQLSDARDRWRRHCPGTATADFTVI